MYSAPPLPRSLRCRTFCLGGLWSGGARLSLSTPYGRIPRRGVHTASPAPPPKVELKSVQVVCTMATEECRRELHLLLTTLRHHHPQLPVVVGCTSSLMPKPSREAAATHNPEGVITGSDSGPSTSASTCVCEWENEIIRTVYKNSHHTSAWATNSYSIARDAFIHWIPCLDRFRYPPYAGHETLSDSFSPSSSGFPYSRLTRATMERRRGVWFPTQHTDFMMEKAHLMEWALLKHLGETHSLDARTRAPPSAVSCLGSGESATISATTSSSSSRYPLVAFLDVDVCHLGPLPRIPIPFCTNRRVLDDTRDEDNSSVSSPSQQLSENSVAAVGLSPHSIAVQDEALFGRFNGGFLVFQHPETLRVWREATLDEHQNRFYDQSSLEVVWDWATTTMSSRHRKVGATVSSSVTDVNSSVMPYSIPLQHNYGYWRLLQTRESTVAAEASKFHLGPLSSQQALGWFQRSSHEDGHHTRDTAKKEVPTAAQTTIPPMAIHYNGRPLRSVHTHFFTSKQNALCQEEFGDEDSAVPPNMELFNTLIRQWLEECVRHNAAEDSSRSGSASVLVYEKILQLISPVHPLSSPTPPSQE